MSLFFLLYSCLSCFIFSTNIQQKKAFVKCPTDKTKKALPSAGNAFHYIVIMTYKEELIA